ncbi:Peroxisomal targeting signal 1 receptor [Armadillidium vulgare]|nr:Peroxisomal targeting signal 1 receptor [Armadillidium vulgare]
MTRFFTMALRNLVEQQCGEGNALVSLSHHITKDKAHKEETHFIPSHEVESFRAPYGVAISADLLAEEFMNETRNAATAPQTFRMDTLLQEMQAIDRTPPLIGPAVADLASDAGTWQKEYLDSENYYKSYLQDSFPDQIQKSEENWLTVAERQWSKALSDMSRETESVAWAEEYDPQSDSELAKTANELLGTVEDPKFSNTEFMKYVRTLGKSGLTDSVKSWQNEYFNSPHSLEANLWSQEFISSNPIDGASWGEEFMKEVANRKHENFEKYEQWGQEYEAAMSKGSFEDVKIDSEAMNAKEKEEFWEKLESDWLKAAKEKNGDHPWLSDYDADFGEPFKEYRFREDNPVKDHPDALAEGKKCLQAGDIPSAVLFFEAAVQQAPDNSEAWLLLGHTHAENEQDISAIPALRRGLELEPSNVKGWMALATSYTNESYQNLACNALKEWMKNNVEYNHLVDKETTNAPHSRFFVASLASREQVEEIQTLFLKAANLRPADNVDANVQCGLGVLFNLTGDYDKAVDCFQAALHANSSDPAIWNKLGATLANGNRSAEAIDAYRNALQLSPGFIRCRYNLGIACINLGSHREAMGHFLEALNMQEKSKGLDSKGSSRAISDNIWSTVRICLKSLDAHHLSEAVANRDLSKLNEEFEIGRIKS